MVHSDHARSSILIDLFNLPSLPYKRRSTTMISEFPNDFSYQMERTPESAKSSTNGFLVGKHQMVMMVLG